MVQARMQTREENITENMRRMREYPCCGGVGYVRANVPYGHPDFGKAIICDQCSKYDAIAYASVRSLSVVPLDLVEMQADWTSFPPGVDENALQSMRNYAKGIVVKRFPQRGVLLRGNNQTGKSGMAYCVHAQMSDAQIPSVYLPIHDLFEALHKAQFALNDFGKPDVDAYGVLMDRLARVRHLVIDDLGASKITEDREDKLFTLIMRRVSNTRCYTTITTNLENKALLSVVDKRIYARITSNNFVQLVVNGEMNALNGVR